MIPDPGALQADNERNPDAADFSLLASAIAGRRVTTRYSKSGFAYTDGEVVYLAPGEQMMTGLVVQAGLLACGSLPPSITSRLAGRASLSARFLTLESHRLLTELGGLMPKAVCEVIRKNWTGRGSASADESFSRALSRESIPLAPAHFGTINARVVAGGGLIGGRSALSEAELSRARQPPSLPDEEDDPDQNAESSTLLKLMAPPGGSDHSMSKFLKSLFGAGSTPAREGDGGAGSDFGADRAKWVKKISARAKAIAAAFGIEEPDRSEGVGAAYPEWDSRLHRYRPHWCYVSHYDPVAAAGASTDSVADLALVRRLARLRSLLSRHRRQAEGDDLDIGALVDFVIENASGQGADERVYEALRRTARDLTAVVLLDASGSTNDQQAGGTSVWEAQRTLAGKLVTALHSLGDRVAAYGFRSFGRNDVRFVRIKDFDERFGQEARSRLQSLTPSGYTRLGAAVRHATELLCHRGTTKNRLLVLVSDGLPYDTDYEREYAERDVQHALSEAAVRGVGCVALTIGSSVDTATLERVWGQVSHASLRTTDELSRHAETLFRTALRRAALAATSRSTRSTAGA